ncbi:MAG TPA: Calx-beta domain-containing protein [Xanthobacteraceae bacterium]|jgi:hypothetical protein|nr:Calx-beta domain-containing protein [Xanthobacteraceae bacterium]
MKLAREFDLTGARKLQSLAPINGVCHQAISLAREDVPPKLVKPNRLTPGEGFVQQSKSLIFGALTAVFLATTSSTAFAEPQIYSYDSLGRLIQVQRGSSPSVVYSGYSYDKAGNRTNTVVSTQPVLPPDPVSFSIADASATEGGNLLFVVSKAGTTTSTLTVFFSTSNNSAVAPSDYGAASATVTFLPSETSKTVTIGTVDDTLVEVDEFMFATLSAPSTGAVLGTSQATGTILDNEDPTGGGCLLVDEGQSVTPQQQMMLPPGC